ncbi:MAG TPA: 5'-nucleotidase, partial [Longimicrobiaceae bacterium]|nr:5'-nucleotidase [Longimicrobiaceae bacterium]
YARRVEAAWRDSLRARVPFLDQVIGRSATLLDATEETVRNTESAWGSWLADQMRGAFPTVPADVAVLNGGAIRIDDQFEGDIRWEHLARTFGFPTRVGLAKVRGADLRTRILERGVGGGRGEGRFLQVSGLRVRFDRSRPEGGRVLDVQVQRGEGWVPLADDSVYTVAVPDYLLGGGDGYPFPEVAIATVPPGPELKLIAFDVLSTLFAAGRAIAPVLEGRLVDVSQPPRAAPAAR